MDKFKEGNIMQKKQIQNNRKTGAYKVCSFLNKLAYTASSSYSFMGPYEPKKPTQLNKK